MTHRILACAGISLALLTPLGQCLLQGISQAAGGLLWKPVQIGVIDTFVVGVDVGIERIVIVAALLQPVAQLITQRIALPLIELVLAGVVNVRVGGEDDLVLVLEEALPGVARIGSADLAHPPVEVDRIGKRLVIVRFLGRLLHFVADIAVERRAALDAIRSFAVVGIFPISPL